MIFRTDRKRLPWRIDGSRDLIARRTAQRRRPVPPGRARRAVRPSWPSPPDGKTLYVANYLADAVQVVDAEAAKLVCDDRAGRAEDAVAGASGRDAVPRRDACRSTSGIAATPATATATPTAQDFDTLNDGRQDLSTAHLEAARRCRPCAGSRRPAPGPGTAGRPSLEDAMVESFTKSMQGQPSPQQEEVKALVAYLDTLDYPRNPYRDPDGTLTSAAKRGRHVFRSAKAACNTCHGGPEFTDGKIHMVGLEEPGDVYRGLQSPVAPRPVRQGPLPPRRPLENPPRGPRRPAQPGHRRGRLGGVSDQELDDLIVYLKSL